MSDLHPAIRLIHPDGTRITLWLPAPMSTAGEAMMALAKLGFDFDRSEEEEP